ncbi:hypothetical protein LOK41_19505 [Bacillus sp. TL12]|nr:hypothetical protein [Bacillus sp. TL12]MCI0766951.1 hypothetical protein [Bacillus sp. TL12]
MIAETNLKVVCEEEFLDREPKILETCITTLLGHSNAFATKEGMFINPLDKDSNVLYYKNFVFVKSLEKPKCA